MQLETAARPAGARRAVEQQRWRLLLGWLRREGTRARFLPRQGDLVGGFLLEEKLGAGSYGTVYRARRGDGLFAVKLLYLPRAGEWALRELEVLLRLHRVGLVAVDSHGHHGHCPGFGPLFLYLVTGYVPGLPMDVWAERHNPVALEVARAVLALAAQLVLAHALDVVHRDIKPDNVVVREGDGRPVLVDYGVGTFPGALKVTGGLVLGAAPYRAPEAWRFRRQRREGESYEASAGDDLWALGVLFYWLLTGTWPFDGEREEDVEDAVLHSVPVAPRVRNPRVPEALSDVCLRMLEKEPQARYPGAEAVCEALEAVLARADAGWEVPLSEAWGPDTAAACREGESRASVSPAMGADVPRAVAVPPRARAGWGSLLVLGAVALFVAVCPRSAIAPVAAPYTGAAVPVLSATPASVVAWALSGQEVAPPWCPLEGGGGAAPAWAPTPAPVAFATLAKDSTRVKTQQQDSGTQEKQQRKGTVRNAVAKALCTATASALAAGCPGAQVRDTPAPEACPPGSLEAMRRLGIETGDESGTQFPGVREEDFWTVREGPGAQLRLGEPLGKLEAGTVLTGRLLFGKERVYGRFTEAHRPGGETVPVCVEAWDTGSDYGRGLVREPNPNGGPDTAKVGSFPDVKAVERFE